MGRVLGSMTVVLLAAAGFVATSVLDLICRVWYGVPAVWHWLVEWPARRRVRLTVERATGTHVGKLVPEQRRSPDPVWWEFVPQQPDGEQ